MTTGISDPIIRPIATNLRPKFCVKPAERIEVSYDAIERKLRVGEETTEQNIFILDRVEFNIREGERQGCASSGYLGFVTGEQKQDGHITMQQFARMEPVRWDYYRFVNNKGKRIVSADQVMIVSSTMMALNPITD